jgi:HD superfamily phosphohydrolase
MPRFRDPVHGFIDVSEDEQKIIGSAPFQRLRNIRQLATAYLVYHGAEHTRFGHSIGVMHLVTEAFNSVVKSSPNLFRDDFEENEVVVEWYRQILRLIALTHDLGHGPFSHAAEGLFEAGLSHEVYTKKIILETVVGDYINEIGNKFTSLHGKKYEITPELVWMIYEGKDVLNPKFILPDFLFLKSFMDGELDCDKMDYLLRDSLYCGVTYGKYDLDRFISTLTVYKDKSKNVMSLAISSGGIQAFEEFVLARYFMFIQVYFHRTKRYFDRLLVEVIKGILPNGKFPCEIVDYLKWDDVQVMHEMRQTMALPAQQFITRQVMSCVYETPAHATKSEKRNVQNLLNDIREKFPAVDIQFDEVDKKAHKLLPTEYLLDDESGRDIKVVNMHTGKLDNVMDCSLILRGIIKEIYICRLYAKGNGVNEVKRYIDSRT